MSYRRNRNPHSERDRYSPRTHDRDRGALPPRTRSSRRHTSEDFSYSQIEAEDWDTGSQMDETNPQANGENDKESKASSPQGQTKRSFKRLVDYEEPDADAEPDAEENVENDDIARAKLHRGIDRVDKSAKKALNFNQMEKSDFEHKQEPLTKSSPRKTETNVENDKSTANVGGTVDTDAILNAFCEQWEIWCRQNMPFTVFLPPPSKNGEPDVAHSSLELDPSRGINLKKWTIAICHAIQSTRAPDDSMTVVPCFRVRDQPSGATESDMLASPRALVNYVFGNTATGSYRQVFFLTSAALDHRGSFASRPRILALSRLFARPARRFAPHSPARHNTLRVPLTVPSIEDAIRSVGGQAPLSLASLQMHPDSAKALLTSLGVESSSICWLLNPETLHLGTDSILPSQSNDIDHNELEEEETEAKTAHSLQSEAQLENKIESKKVVGNQTIEENQPSSVEKKQDKQDDAQTSLIQTVQEAPSKILESKIEICEPAKQAINMDQNEKIHETKDVTKDQGISKHEETMVSNQVNQPQSTKQSQICANHEELTLQKVTKSKDVSVQSTNPNADKSEPSPKCTKVHRDIESDIGNSPKRQKLNIENESESCIKGTNRDLGDVCTPVSPESNLCADQEQEPTKSPYFPKFSNVEKMDTHIDFETKSYTPPNEVMKMGMQFMWHMCNDWVQQVVQQQTRAVHQQVNTLLESQKESVLNYLQEVQKDNENKINGLRKAIQDYRDKTNQNLDTIQSSVDAFMSESSKKMDHVYSALEKSGNSVQIIEERLLARIEAVEELQCVQDDMVEAWSAALIRRKKVVSGESGASGNEWTERRTKNRSFRHRANFDDRITKTAKRGKDFQANATLTQESVDQLDDMSDA